VCRAEVLAAKTKVSASGKVLECLKSNLGSGKIADGRVGTFFHFSPSG
jgi:hypothetical protein